MASEQPQTELTNQLQTIVLEARESPPQSSSISTHSDERSHLSSTEATSSSFGGGNVPHPPVWTHRVSASFNAMAEQISAASRAIALIPPLPDTLNTQFEERLNGIAETQKRLEGELTALKEQFAQITEGPERFQKQLDDMQAAFKLEQDRLPARLHNALVTVNKVAIKPIVMANGKFPPQFPATRGEFEHLIRERYEALMKSYDIPISGDTAAKRETLRAFIGLPK